MSEAREDSFAPTIQETSLWLDSLIEKAGIWNDKDFAWKLLGATLHALRDRLQPEAAIHFGAQLPMLVRGLYYEHWVVDPARIRERHKAQFLDHVSQELPAGTTADPEGTVRAVFGVMRDKIDPGEIAKLSRQMPKELRQLW